MLDEEEFTLIKCLNSISLENFKIARVSPFNYSYINKLFNKQH